MSQVCTIGLDIAKNKFQVHGENKRGVKIFNKQLRRDEGLNFFASLPPCLVGLEACGGSHYWARELSKLGHDVKLIPPRHVKPFVINNKTDAADARAICEVVVLTPALSRLKLLNNSIWHPCIGYENVLWEIAQLLQTRSVVSCMRQELLFHNAL